MKKAKDMHGVPSHGKASHSKKSSGGLNKLNSKGEDTFSGGSTAFVKKDSSCCTNSSSMKSKPSGDSTLIVGVSTMEDSQTKKNAASLPRKTTSEQKTVRSLLKSSKISVSDKLSKARQDEHRIENQDNKLDLPVALSSRISKKNRKINCRIEKRTKSNNIKHAGYISNDQCGDGSLCPESIEFNDTRQETRLLRFPRKKQFEVAFILNSHYFSKRSREQSVFNFEFFSFSCHISQSFPPLSLR